MITPKRAMQILLFEAGCPLDSLPTYVIDLILHATEYRARKLIDEGIYPKFTDEVTLDDNP